MTMPDTVGMSATAHTGSEPHHDLAYDDGSADVTDSHDSHVGHGAGHGAHGAEPSEPLGPVDLAGWLAAAAGGAVGLLVAAALAVARA